MRSKYWIMGFEDYQMGVEHVPHWLTGQDAKDWQDGWNQAKLDESKMEKF